ncbi:hypothetical protein Nepgr_029990 [Nepenthes gracilis]|uniref:Uncharacterized protein n=1 Tax=Nepenthes gracilis TaxID=150966 RepID=A0AAD3TEZ0_NEPGR|nr:hypothetical protein Nepgr_029990 [Nepenthes gracilis]
MMRMASTLRELPPKKDGSSSPNGSRGRGGGAGGGGGEGESRSVDWELRPVGCWFRIHLLPSHFWRIEEEVGGADGFTPSRSEAAL